MSFLETLSDLLQKPQSAAMGTYAGLLKMIDPRQDIEDRLGGDDPISGLMAGLKGNIRPRHVQNYLNNDYRYGHEGLGKQGLNTLADTVIDPLLFLGPAVKSGALGTKAAKGANAALSAGKYAPGLSKGEKLSTAAARALRRTYQGTLATGDVTSGFGAGVLMGVGENKLANVLARRLPKLANTAIEDVLVEDLDDVGSAIKVANLATPIDDLPVKPLVPGSDPTIPLTMDNFRKPSAEMDLANLFDDESNDTITRAIRILSKGR